MSQNHVVISVYADRLEASGVPTVRARVEPLRVVVRWLDQGTWEQVDVCDLRRMDGSNVATLPPDPH